MKAPVTTRTRDADPRRPFQSEAQLSWQTRSGENKVARATFVDLSQQGAGIHSVVPIEPQTMVYLQAPGYGAIGNASVRYCIRAGLKYRIGLLFGAPYKWADSARQRYLERPRPGLRACEPRSDSSSHPVADIEGMPGGRPQSSSGWSISASRVKVRAGRPHRDLSIRPGDSAGSVRGQSGRRCDIRLEARMPAIEQRLPSPPGTGASPSGAAGPPSRYTV